MGSTTKAQRNYGLDLLRMFAMFLIAVLHILGQGGVLNAAFPDADKYDAAWLLEIGAYCAVNCYALISGYVGLNSKFRYSGIIMLWLRVLFYTLSITVIFYFVMPQALLNDENTKNMFFIISEKWDNALFPVSTKQYWYFTAYFFCYFFTPILNKAVHTLERRQLKRALIAIVGTISIPALYTGNDVFWTSRGYSAIWLIVLYLVGAYMKKYNSFSYIGKFTALYGYLASVVLTWNIKILLTENLPEFTRPNLLVSYTSPTIIASGIFLFIFFKNLNPPKFFLQGYCVFITPCIFGIHHSCASPCMAAFNERLVQTTCRPSDSTYGGCCNRSCTGTLPRLLTYRPFKTLPVQTCKTAKACFCSRNRNNRNICRKGNQRKGSRNRYFIKRRSC